MPFKPRILLVVGIAAALGAFAGWTHVSLESDFTKIHQAALVWRNGGDPYAITSGSFPFMYPFTAVLFGLPFTFLPLPDVWFVAFGVGLFVWGITSDRRWRFVWLSFLTPALITTVRMSQWSALLMGAALTPAWGFLLACKPTIGAALWMAFPSKRAFIGGLLLVALSMALLPDWPIRFVNAVSGVSHLQAPVTFWGGPLLLLAGLRWRWSEARLLLALACVPQTHFYYDALPLFLIPRSFEQALTLTMASAVVPLALPWATGSMDGWSPAAVYLAERQATGQLTVYLLYLPCLAMVLSRHRHPAKSSEMAPPLPSEAPSRPWKTGITSGRKLL